MHMIWLGGELPPVLKRFTESWKDHHPSWTFVMWTDATLPELKNRSFIENAERFVPEANVGQFKADILRYEILERFGGVYVDTDFECLKPIDALLDGVEAFAAWEKQDVWVNNAILGCVPHAPFIKRCVQGLAWSIASNKGSRPNVSTGPQYLTRLFREDPEGLTVFDQKLFYPYSYSETSRIGEEFPDAVAVHHWNNARKKLGVGL